MEQDQLIDAVTKEIMNRLGGSSGAASVVVFGDVPAGVIAPGVATTRGQTPADVNGHQVIVLTIDAFRGFHGNAVAPAPAGASASAPCATCGPSAGGQADLTGKRLISERDLKAACEADGCTVRVGASALLTALAKDYCKAHAITVVKS